MYNSDARDGSCQASDSFDNCLATEANVFEFIWQFKTRVGNFYVAKCDEGKFQPVFKNIELGDFDNDFQAANALSMNLTSFDTSGLGIPDDLSNWERVDELASDNLYQHSLFR